MTEDLRDSHHLVVPGLKLMKVRNLISSIAHPQGALARLTWAGVGGGGGGGGV